MIIEPICPKCNSKDLVKNGKNNNNQMYSCKKCAPLDNKYDKRFVFSEDKVLKKIDNYIKEINKENPYFYETLLNLTKKQVKTIFENFKKNNININYSSKINNLKDLEKTINTLEILKKNYINNKHLKNSNENIEFTIKYLNTTIDVIEKFLNIKNTLPEIKNIVLHTIETDIELNKNFFSEYIIKKFFKFSVIDFNDTVAFFKERKLNLKSDLLKIKNELNRIFSFEEEKIFSILEKIEKLKTTDKNLEELKIYFDKTNVFLLQILSFVLNVKNIHKNIHLREEKIDEIENNKKLTNLKRNIEKEKINFEFSQNCDFSLNKQILSKLVEIEKICNEDFIEIAATKYLLVNQKGFNCSYKYFLGDNLFISDYSCFSHFFNENNEVIDNSFFNELKKFINIDNQSIWFSSTRNKNIIDFKCITVRLEEIENFKNFCNNNNVLLKHEGKPFIILNKDKKHIKKDLVISFDISVPKEKLINFEYTESIKTSLKLKINLNE